MNNQYFAQCTNADEAKKLYRKLAKELHPDKQGGNEKEFKELGKQYAEFLQGKRPGTKMPANEIIKNILDGIDNDEFEAYVNMLQDMYPNIKILQHAKKTLGVIKLINQIL